MSVGAPELLTFLLVFGLLALIPAKIAADKGRSFAGWFVLGLLFFVPALIGALVISGGPSGQAPSAAVLQAVEAAPGSTQQQLALRTGLPVAKVLEALTELQAARMVQLEPTGQEFTIGRHTVPVVTARPA